MTTTLHDQTGNAVRHWWQHPGWRLTGRVTEVSLALAIGMIVFLAPWSALVGAVSTAWGVGGLPPMEAAALAMVITMAAGATIWMLHRGYSSAAIGAVTAIALLSFLLPYAAAWFGWWSAGTALLAGHLIVIPAVVTIMIIFRRRFRPGAGGRSVGYRVLRMIGDRWPSWLALAATFDQWIDPGPPPLILLVALGAEHLVIGAMRRQFADRRLLWWQVAGFAFYLVLAGVALVAGPETAAIIIGVGWLLHAIWDGILHRINKVTWRWYAEACFWIDLVIGVSVLFLR